MVLVCERCCRGLDSVFSVCDKKKEGGGGGVISLSVQGLKYHSPVKISFSIEAFSSIDADLFVSQTLSWPTHTSCDSFGVLSSNHLLR